MQTKIENLAKKIHKNMNITLTINLYFFHTKKQSLTSINAYDKIKITNKVKTFYA